MLSVTVFFWGGREANMPPTLPLEVGCIFFGGDPTPSTWRIIPKVVSNHGDRNFPK